MAGPLGLIAGSGNLPFMLARAARASGRFVAVAGLSGNADPALSTESDVFQEVKPGRLGALIRFFQDHGVTHVAMGGNVDKARAMDLVPDMRGAKVLARLIGRGDDAILRAVIEELESEGMAVLRTHDLLPELLTPEGVLCGKPGKDMLADISFGWSVAKAMGGLDIGQTVVVRKGVVMAVEAIEGTDEAIRRGCELGGKGAVVVKVFKPGQDERADLPAVGPKTIETMRQGKAACLAVEAGKSLFFEQDQALGAAKSAGICVVGVDDGRMRDGAQDESS